MFDLCKNVHIYNIENHYHYYDPRQKQERIKDKLRTERLYAAPITVTSSVVRNKRQTLRLQRKGIQLSKTFKPLPLPSHKKFQSQELPQKKQQQRVIEMQRFIPQISHKDLLYSTKCSHSTKVKNRSIFYEDELMSSLKFKQSNNNALYKPNSSRQACNQEISRKAKPINPSRLTMYSIPVNSKKMSTGSPHQLCSTRLNNSTKSQKITPNSSMSSQISNNSYRQEQSQFSFIIQKQGSICVFDTSQRESQLLKSQVNNGSYSDNQHNNTYSISQPSIVIHDCPNNDIPLYPEGKNNATITINEISDQSAPINISSKDENKLVLQPKNSKLFSGRNSAIYLSQIFSHDSSRHDLTQILNTKKSRLFKDLDRVTIKSYENDFSELSLHIEQSIICDHNGLNNFEEIKRQNYEKYILVTALENETNCLVTLKEQDFMYMNRIAQELKAYQILEELIPADSQFLVNILTLYQVQLNKHSYILIKQPYELSLNQYLVTVSRKHQQSKQFQNEIMSVKQQMQKIIYKISATMLSGCQMMLTRQLKISDFVYISGVIKLENLEGFVAKNEPQHSNNPLNNIQTILHNLSLQIQDITHNN